LFLNETNLLFCTGANDEIWCKYVMMTLVKISAGADGGPRSWVCARLTLCLAPINTSKKIHLEYLVGGGDKNVDQFSPNLTEQICFVEVSAERERTCQLYAHRTTPQPLQILKSWFSKIC
jgi:hypothetical protein